ncbi:MAG: Na+/H+ antiporter NhaA [Magnetococcales bacterium]|nr:Na+/H+ antiporter NhaA [Magnetococcales bacterium]
MALRLKALCNREILTGSLLFCAAIVGLIWNNSSFHPWYDALLGTEAGMYVGNWMLSKPLLLWINDGLMTIFFLMVGMEIKYELLQGSLVGLERTILPGLAALGGMVVPALLYTAINWHSVENLKGWAIPSATDIAFTMAILAVLGKRVPRELRIFIMALAILDDLGAIIIIAVAYTETLSWASLILASLAISLLILFNRAGVVRLDVYLVVGLFLWMFVLKSGVHATLAGVVLAFAIPLKGHRWERRSPLRNLEFELHPWVVCVIMPVFALANTGIPLESLTLDRVMGTVSMGIVIGLCLGKPLGIYGMTLFAVKMGWGKLPLHVTWYHLLGGAILCGTGFTMSLFIGSLAFEFSGSGIMMNDDRIGILLGSSIAAVSGYIVLRMAPIIAKDAQNG